MFSSSEEAEQAEEVGEGHLESSSTSDSEELDPQVARRNMEELIAENRRSGSLQQVILYAEIPACPQHGDGAHLESYGPLVREHARMLARAYEGNPAGALALILAPGTTTSAQLSAVKYAPNLTVRRFFEDALRLTGVIIMRKEGSLG